MGVYGNIHGAFNGLGKPSIKLEFEDNDELLAFQQRMQEPDGGNDDPDGGNFTPADKLIDRLSRMATGKPYLKVTRNEPADEEPVEGVELSEKDFFEILDNNIEPYVYKDFTPQNIVSEFGQPKHRKDSFGNVKYAFKINTPLKGSDSTLYIWADMNHALFDNSTKENRSAFWTMIKPTIERPAIVFEKDGKNHFVKCFNMPNGDKIMFSFIPSLVYEKNIKTFLVRDERKKRQIYKKYKDGGSIKFLDSYSTFNGIERHSEPILFVECRLYADKDNSNISENQIFNEKSLDGYGDFYTVRDMRKRSRKEPGDVAANKNLQFTKDSSRTIQNFDKDLYLAEQVNPYNFDKEVNGKKYVHCDVNVSGRWQDDTRVESYYVNVWFFSPRKKNGKNTFKGYDTYVPVDVKLYDFVNLERRKSSEFCGYVLESKYKEWFNEALKKQIAAYQRTIRSGNSFAAENAKDLKYLVEYYSNIDKYTAYVMHNYGDPTLLNPATVEEYKRYIDISIFDGVTLGKAANNALYNNLEILDFRGMQPTYRQLPDYSQFFAPATNKNSLKGWGLNDTKKLIADICRNHYKECAAIAKHLKAETKLQSAFNLWHWLHHNIRYEYDREGREEVRTPSRTWADRHRGVDCDCLSVFAWCVLKCMGYNPAFELAAFRNKPAYSHIYINLDGIVIDRVWFVFDSRPPGVTKTELFKVGMLDNLGQLF